jgi:uncharacterized protein YecE (DUF72 family)
MNQNRVKTDIDRKAQIVEGGVKIQSDVSEEIPMEIFFDTVKQKQDQKSNLQQQLSAIKSQLKQVNAQLPPLTAEEENELNEMKRKINLIRDLDKADTLRTNIQKMEVDLNLLEKETKVFADVMKDLDKLAEKNSIGNKTINYDAEVKKNE